VTELLDQIIGRLHGLPPEQVAKIDAEIAAATARMPWIPNVGPQTQAYYCRADVLLYGGQGGGGKSFLLVGCAFTQHQRSLIMRRRYTDLGALIEEALKLNGGRDGFNGSAPPKLRTREGRLIEFGAAHHLGDEQNWQGQPHDGLFLDEAVQFAESQVRFLMGWVRTTDEGRRTRTVLASNPPVSTTGEWVIGMFRPWLDLTHAKPAKPGELRWYVTAPDGKDLEVDGAQPREFDGKTYRPLSRTFIPASVDDNPFLVRTGYKAQLDNLQEPWRSAVRDGNFMAARADDERQVIPSAWVRAAQKRWNDNPRPPEGVPMTAIGVDIAAGGADDTVLAPRYDTWYAPLVAVPGKDTPTPSSAAALVVQHRRDGAAVVVDVGGGYGGGVVEHLKGNGIQTVRFNGANSSTTRTKDKMLGFVNKRAEAWWRLREALDPDQAGGSPLALPDDPVLAGDLTAPTFDVGTRGILIEDKDAIKVRLGRSPDRGDAAVMAWSEGQAAIRRRMYDGGGGQHADGGRYGSSGSGGRQTQCNVGYAHLKRRRTGR